MKRQEGRRGDEKGNRKETVVEIWISEGRNIEKTRCGKRNGKGR